MGINSITSTADAGGNEITLVALTCHFSACIYAAYIGLLKWWSDCEIDAYQLLKMYEVVIRPQSRSLLLQEATDNILQET